MSDSKEKKKINPTVNVGQVIATELDLVAKSRRMATGDPVTRKSIFEEAWKLFKNQESMKSVLEDINQYVRPIDGVIQKEEPSPGLRNAETDRAEEQVRVVELHGHVANAERGRGERDTTPRKATKGTGKGGAKGTPGEKLA